MGEFLSFSEQVSNIFTSAMDYSKILAIAGLAGTTLAPLVLFELDLARKRKEYPLGITKDYGRWIMYTGVLHNCP